ncbi:receptor-like protein 51 [Canna indica]|uniref:Receptor-like protein 51 n=1 Tax=Canna indica TaxID=4628 RepID=A0AAQ3KRZ6_9LILI|nr:receptor-like protein 51 [Canna indica]
MSLGKNISVKLIALQSVGFPTARHPCGLPSPHDNATTYDDAAPFRHLVSLRLANYSPNLDLPTTALRALSTLCSLSFLRCPVPTPKPLPGPLAGSLYSFSHDASLHSLSNVWLSRLQNLTDLSVVGVPITASGPAIIPSRMCHFRLVTISATNLTGVIPHHWHALNLVHLNLSSNLLLHTTRCPDRSQLNVAAFGTHPTRSELKSGVFPFNASFVQKLEVFKVGGNNDLCYNHSRLSSKLKLGIARYDKYGQPVPPPPYRSTWADSDYSDDGSDDESGDRGSSGGSHHGPSKLVLGVAIGLSCVVFLIIFLVCLSKVCG